MFSQRWLLRLNGGLIKMEEGGPAQLEEKTDKSDVYV